MKSDWLAFSGSASAVRSTTRTLWLLAGAGAIFFAYALHTSRQNATCTAASVTSAVVTSAGVAVAFTLTFSDGSTLNATDTYPAGTTLNTAQTIPPSYIGKTRAWIEADITDGPH